MVSIMLQGDGGIDYLFGIAPTGVVIYRNKTKIVSHFWSVVNSVSLSWFVFTWVAQWHSGTVLDLWSIGHGFNSHRDKAV